MVRFINKKSFNLKRSEFLNNRKPYVQEQTTKPLIQVKEETKENVMEIPVNPSEVKIGKKNKKEKNKETKIDEVMDNSVLQQAEMLVNTINGVDESRIKRVKNNGGLIERTESSKIILTEDNRQILND